MEEKELYSERRRGRGAACQGGPGRFFLVAMLLVAGGTAGWDGLRAQDNLYGINIGPYPGSGVNTRANPGIASGSHSGFYIRMAEDIANLCAKPLNPVTGPFRLNVISTQGGFDSVKRLRLESDLQLAVVQSDLWYYAKMFGEPAATPGSGLSDKARESWRQIADEVRLLIPLYTEKIHIVVTPYGRDRFGDLMGLFREKARVSVGTGGSGSMITAALIEDMVLRWMQEKGEEAKTWVTHHWTPDVALQKLAKQDGELDAVILVGGVPYPALEKFGMQEVKKTGGIFSRSVSVTPLALLPVGAEADALFEANPIFSGYVKTSIKATDYEFLTGEQAEVATRGVTACLVTHKSYLSDSRSAEARQKLLWVRHVLFRILTNLDQSSPLGLDEQFGVPEAGEKWREVWEQLRRIEGGELAWEAFGWSRHDDPVLQRMADAWAGSYDSRPRTRVIDPDKF